MTSARVVDPDIVLKVDGVPVGTPVRDGETWRRAHEAPRPG